MSASESNIILKLILRAKSVASPINLRNIIPLISRYLFDGFRLHKAKQRWSITINMASLVQQLI